MSEPQEEESKKYRCLCSLMHVRTGTIVVGLLEFLLISHSLIFVCSTIASGEKRYLENNENFSKVIQYKFMHPTLVIQSVWIVTIIVMLLGIKAINPYMTLPHFVVEICAVIYGVVLTVFFLVNVRQSHLETVSWELGLVIALFLAVTLIEVYFVIVSFYCFRFLVHQKTAVQAQKKITKFYTNTVNSANQHKGRRKITKDSDSSSMDEESAVPKLPIIENPIRPLAAPLRAAPSRLSTVREHSVEDGSDDSTTTYSGTSRMGSALPPIHGEQDRAVTEVTVEPTTIASKSNGVDVAGKGLPSVPNPPAAGQFEVPKIYVEPATDAEDSRPSTLTNGVIPQEARPATKPPGLHSIHEGSVPNLPKVQH